jgi:hypothetical protein
VNLAPRAVVRVPPRPLARAKFRALCEQTAADAVDPQVVRMASWLTRVFAPDDYLARAREIYRFTRDGIRYQHDPDKREEFAPSATILERRWDDCDGKAKVAVAMMRAVGLDAQIWPVWRGGFLAHAQIRVRFPGSTQIAGSRGGWIYADPTIRGAELTQPPQAVASNPDTGRLPLSGGPLPHYLAALE